MTNTDTDSIFDRVELSLELFGTERGEREIPVLRDDLELLLSLARKSSCAGDDEVVEKCARAIYDATDTQSGDTIGTVIWNSEHLFYETVEGEEIVDTARRACMPTCRDAARAVLSVLGEQRG